MLFGTVGSFRGALQMVSPVVDVLRTADDRDEVDEPRTGRIFPVYPLSERANLTSARISRFVHEALDRAGTLADPLSDGRRQSLGMVDRTVAFNDIHRPSVDGRRSSPLAAAWPSTSCSVCNLHSCCASTACRRTLAVFAM